MWRLSKILFTFAYKNYWLFINKNRLSQALSLIIHISLYMVWYIARVRKLDVLRHCGHGPGNVIHITNTNKISIYIFKLCLTFLYISHLFQLSEINQFYKGFLRIFIQHFFLHQPFVIIESYPFVFIFYPIILLPTMVILDLDYDRRCFSSITWRYQLLIWTLAISCWSHWISSPPIIPDFIYLANEIFLSIERSCEVFNIKSWYF